ncbi:MAG: HEAT repeat domain-containing protein [Cyanobacteria bacterium]|nr:HEAT repeat domain-containing protein [Cyanobacteriota bacterium]
MSVTSRPETVFSESNLYLDRVLELKTLQHCLDQAKQGQAQTVLISGEPGIGKTSLIEAFCRGLRKEPNTRVLDLRHIRLSTPQTLFLDIVAALQHLGQSILDETLANINEITHTLGFQWQHADLRRAISLVKIQESIGGKTAIQHENLVKALRSAVPPSKKLKLSVQEQIEEMAYMIANPWLNVAIMLETPIDTPLADVAVYANQVKTHWESEKQTLQRPVVKETTGLDFSPIEMAQWLNHLFVVLSEQLLGTQSAFILLFDNWQATLNLPEVQREGLKQFVTAWFSECQQTADQDYPCMMVLSCESQGQSYSLGRELFGEFSQIILLSGLSPEGRLQLLNQPFEQAGIEVDTPVYQAIIEVAHSNPYWMLKLQKFLLERAQANSVTRIDWAFYQQLQLEDITMDLFESSLTRIQLQFLHNESLLNRLLSVLVRDYGERPFTLQEVVSKVLKTAEGPSKSDEWLLCQMLNALFYHGFLGELSEAPPSEHTSSGSRAQAVSIPYYQIESLPVYRFLQRKAAAPVESDIPTQDKLTYLKRVIPLSIKSGELDREKTKEVLALCEALGNHDMLAFLEETFLQHVHDEAPIVRVNALNNLALLESQAALNEAIEALTHDENPMVREYAARNLMVLSERIYHSASHDRIFNALCASLDDESEVVRAEVYATISRYRWSYPIEAIFLKGLVDAHTPVRLMSIQGLVSLLESTRSKLKANIQNSQDNASSHDNSQGVSQILSADAKRAIHLALNDADPAVRKEAVTGCVLLGTADSLELLRRVLFEDPEIEVRMTVAERLAKLEHSVAQNILMEALEHSVVASEEEMSLLLVRAMGRRVSPEAENVLLSFIHKREEDLETEAPALLWMCARSLGQMAISVEALALLRRLETQAQQEIILMTIRQAITKIRARQAVLKQELSVQEAGTVSESRRSARI